MRTVNPLPAGTLYITNTTFIGDDGANGADPTPENNTDTVQTPLMDAPNLQVSKSDGGIASTAGGIVIYTLTYTNAGGIGATGVVVSETLPLNTSYAAAPVAPGGKRGVYATDRRAARGRSDRDADLCGSDHVTASGGRNGCHQHSPNQRRWGEWR
jgi:uncharacterized repeat protein (TIGR01451 family)